jgi:integrase
MFPRHEGEMENVSSHLSRHMFPPAPTPITVERDLRRVCRAWQDAWDERLATEVTPVGIAESPPTLSTLGEVVVHHQSLRRDELAASTMERNKHYLDRWLSALGSQTPLVELTEERLVAARATLLRDLQPSTINCSLACLRSVLRWAEARGLPVHAAYRTLRRVREIRSSSDKAWWTTKEVQIALAAAAEIDQSLVKSGAEGSPGTATLLIAFGCLLGLRYEELVMLRWQDIDLDRVNAETQAPEPVAHIVPHDGWVPKDGEERSVPMHARLVDLVRPYRKQSGWVLNPQKPMPKRGGTKRIYRYDPKKLWLQVLAKAITRGAKAITPHGMRHSFASNLLMAGVSDVLVARWLGHSDTSMVHERYGHLLAYHGDINRVQLDPL